MKQFSAFTEGFGDYGLAIQEEKVKSKDADLNFNIFDFDVLLLSCHELLERENFFLYNIPCYGFAIKYKAFCVWFNPCIQFGQNIGILLGKILGISRENGCKPTTGRLCNGC
jgi:hypothetical protein